MQAPFLSCTKGKRLTATCQLLKLWCIQLLHIQKDSSDRCAVCDLSELWVWCKFTDQQRTRTSSIKQVLKSSIYDNFSTNQCKIILPLYKALWTTPPTTARPMPSLPNELNNLWAIICLQNLTVTDETPHMGDTGWNNCACVFEVFPWKFTVHIEYPFLSCRYIMLKVYR